MGVDDGALGAEMAAIHGFVYRTNALPRQIERQGEGVATIKVDHLNTGIRAGGGQVLIGLKVHVRGFSRGINKKPLAKITLGDRSKHGIPRHLLVRWIMGDILEHLNKSIQRYTPIRAGEKEIDHRGIALEVTMRATGWRTAASGAATGVRHICCLICSGQRLGHQHGTHQHQNAEHQANADDTPPGEPAFSKGFLVHYGTPYSFDSAYVL